MGTDKGHTVSWMTHVSQMRVRWEMARGYCQLDGSYKSNASAMGYGKGHTVSWMTHVSKISD